MTSNDAVVLILRFFTNSTALQADYVTVVEDRHIMSVKYFLLVPVSLLPKTNAPCSVVSAIAEHLVLYYSRTLWIIQCRINLI